MATALKKPATPLLSEGEVAERRAIVAESVHDGVLEGAKPSDLLLELGEAWAVGQITLDEMQQALLENAKAS